MDKSNWFEWNVFQDVHPWPVSWPQMYTFLNVFQFHQLEKIVFSITLKILFQFVPER
jgi:hypothetical protein